MKHYLFATVAAVCLSACAGTKVTNSVIATGASSPKAIYIRPFNIPDGAFQGAHGGEAVRKIRESQAPAAFAGILKEELEKIAPAQVITDNEEAEVGWVVTGDIELVNAGCAPARAALGGLGVGRSGILVHVRVTEAGSKHQSDSKGGRGPVVYEFDVAGGSRLMGGLGTVKNSGVGYAAPFDMRNAAAKIRQTLEVDGNRYGLRESASQ
jgi:hypothetical protein